MPFYLGTNTPSGDPGGAGWINTNTLGGGTLVNQSALSTAPPLATIPGSDTTAQAFAYSFTIPAGVLVPGATMALQWFMSAQLNNVGVDSYKWGFSIGGASTLSGLIVPATPNPPLVSLSAAFGTFGSFASVPPLLDFGALNGYASVGTGETPVVFILLGIDPTVPVPVSMYWEWQAGTDPTSYVDLYSFSVNVTAPV